MTEINLLPEITAEEKLIEQRARRINLYSIGLLATFLVLTIGIFAYWAILANELTTLNQTYADHEKRLSELVEREGLVKGTSFKASRIRLIKPELSPVSPILDAVSLLTRGKIKTDEVTIEGDRLVKMTGTTTSDQQMTDFITQVEQLDVLGEKQVEEVSVNNLTRDSNLGYRVSIKIVLKASSR